MFQSVAERVATERKMRMLETGNWYVKDGNDDPHQSTRPDACIYFDNERTQKELIIPPKEFRKKKPG